MGMTQADVIKQILHFDGLIVSTLGLPSRELYLLGDSSRNFYLLGSMGMASSFGLGIALSQKKRVYVIEGDGAILMNLGSLVTIAHHGPSNYCLIIIDNGVYATTGNQPTPTQKGTNLVKIAKGAGIRNVKQVETPKELRHVLINYENKLLVVVAKVVPKDIKVPIIPYSPVKIKKRFSKELQESQK